MENYVDFSDLVKVSGFKYDGKSYIIPPISNVSMKALMKLHKSVQEQKEGKDKDDDSEKMVAMQEDMMVIAVKHVHDGEAMTKEEASGFPFVVTSQVVKMINEATSVSSDSEKNLHTSAVNTSKSLEDSTEQ